MEKFARKLVFYRCFILWRLETMLYQGMAEQLSVDSSYEASCETWGKIYQGMAEQLSVDSYEASCETWGQKYIKEWLNEHLSVDSSYESSSGIFSIEPVPPPWLSIFQWLHVVQMQRLKSHHLSTEPCAHSMLWRAFKTVESPVMECIHFWIWVVFSWIEAVW